MKDVCQCDLTLRWTLQSLRNLNVVHHTRLDTVAASFDLRESGKR